MGNYRFRLSDMMPNAWFYKLKDMTRTRDSNSLPKKKKMSAYNNKKKKQQKKKNSNKYQDHGSASPSVSASASALSSRTSIDHLQQHIVTHSYYSHPLPGTATEELLLYRNSSSPDNIITPPRTSSCKKSSRKTVYRPSPNPAALLPELNSSSHPKKHSLLTYKHLNTSPPDHYFASPSPPTDNPEEEEQSTSPNEAVTLPRPTSNCKIMNSSTTPTKDIVIDMNHEYSTTSPHIENLTDHRCRLCRTWTRRTPPPPPLPPSFKIIEVDDEDNCRPRLSQKTIRSHTAQQRSPNCTASTTGIRLRTHGSRFATSRRMQAAIRARKSMSSPPSDGSVSFRSKDLATSFVVTKLSADPQSDFKDSMEEMIKGLNIRASKDLEDLLTGFLSVNSREHHDHIVRAFEDIWLDTIRIRYDHYELVR